MSSLLITNGQLVTLDDNNRFIDKGSIYIEGNKIVEVGNIPADKYTPDKTIDAGGNLVMPGLINAHHHLYSTFARGFTPPGPAPRNFEEILSGLWWKLDRALDSEDVYYSALLALMQAARAGCTTVIDHHASPSCRDGSLDQVERAFREVGLSGCLCYEVSDRNEEGEGIEENERYIRKCRDAENGQMAAMFGLHALMTLGTKTLQRCADIAHELDAGFHVHAAEDEADVRITMERYGRRLMDRFLDFGIPGHKTIFVHGVHFEPREMDLVRSTGSILVNNPESNMNNGLGVSPIMELLDHGVTVGVGTDGMSSHMISQARAMYLHQRTEHRDPNLAFAEACEILLRNNREICNRLFRVPRGALAPGQLADIMIPEYVPFTPLNADTFYGHLLFGLGFTRIRTTIARGRVIVDEGRLPHLDEEAIRAQCAERASKIWQSGKTTIRPGRLRKPHPCLTAMTAGRGWSVAALICYWKFSRDSNHPWQQWLICPGSHGWTRSHRMTGTSSSAARSRSPASFVSSASCNTAPAWSKAAVSSAVRRCATSPPWQVTWPMRCRLETAPCRCWRSEARSRFSTAPTAGGALCPTPSSGRAKVP
jgi:putative selenium metabolism protein SsnA